MKWLLIACLTLGGCYSTVPVKAGSTVELIKAKDSRATLDARDELDMWKVRINVTVLSYSLMGNDHVVIAVPSYLTITLVNELTKAGYNVIRIDNNSTYTSSINKLYVKW